MYKPITLADNIYFVGVNDRRTALFENMWPLHRGVSYNSYLIVDEKITLVDTVEAGHIDKWLSRVRSVIGAKPINYLVVNHMEPDHSGAIHLLRELYPHMTIIGNKKTIPMINGFYGVQDSMKEVADGETVSLGERKLTFHTIPMVHWPESMICLEETSGILFSSDAFGSFGALEGGIFDDEIDMGYFLDEQRRYYSNIVGKYGNPVQKALSKLRTLDLQMIAPSHGPIYKTHIDKMVDLYDQWSRYEGEEGVVIAYASMYGNTEEMADAVARSVAENGIKEIRVYDVSKTHPSYIISDIFKYKGLVLGSPTYSNELHPNMEALVLKLQHMGVTSRYFGAFGSFTWAGASLKKLLEAGDSLKWELVTNGVEEKQGLKQEKYDACVALGKAMADRLKADRS